MTALGQWVAALQSPPFVQASFLVAGAIIIAAVIQDYRTLTAPDWLVSLSVLGGLSIWVAAGYAVRGVRMALYIVTLAVFVALAVYMIGGLSRVCLGFGYGDVKLMIPLSLFFPALSFRPSNLPACFQPRFVELVNPLTFVFNTVFSFTVFLIALRIYLWIKESKKLVPLTPVMTASFIGTALFGAFWWAAVTSLTSFLLQLAASAKLLCLL